MNQIIANIKNIPGVVGVAVFKDDGSLAAYDFPEAYDQNLLSLIGLKFQPIKEILPEDEGEIVYLCWEFEDLLGFYYPVGGGWVNIISSDHIPMPVFSLTMTAVANKLPELLKNARVEPVGDTPEQAAGETPAATGKPIPPEKLEELENLFSIYLGPASPVIFKRVALQMGYTLDSVPEDRLKPLLSGVIAKVPDSKREEVMAKVTGYI